MAELSCFLSCFPCAEGGGGGSEGRVSVGFPGHPPPPPFVPVIYKAPLRDDLGQYASSLFVATRKKCGPEVSPSSFLSCIPSSMPPVFTLVLRIGPDRARTHPDSYLWLHDNTSRRPHLVLGLDVFVLHNQYFARVF